MNQQDRELQTRQMLWSNIHRLKNDGYSIERIAYLVDQPEDKVREMLVSPKPKRS
jgi:biotin operon repressor